MPTWTTNIPSQVRTFANLAAFPVTGSVKTIYIAEDTDIAYYWTGSVYVAISIQDLSGLQSKPVVVSSNTTAQNDTVYHVVANATFTDPTPVEGRGYVVFVRNGTVTIGGIPQSNNSIYYRLFHSGGWTTYRFDNSVANNNNFVPQSRTINGLDLTVNRTLTTANINDSTNKRYVTDAEKNSFNLATFTIELLDALTVDFYAPQDLRINTTTVISGSGTVTLQVNNSAYTLTNLISQGAKITVSVNTASVVNLNSAYE